MQSYNLKNLLRGAVAVCVAAGFAACQQLTIDSQKEFPPQMDVDALEAYTLLAQAPNVITFNVSSNTPWTIKSDAQWCTPDPAMSAASSLVSEITVTTEDNNTEKERTAVLTVSAEGVSEPFVIRVTQEARDAFILQAPEEGNVAKAGGNKVFRIISNKPWKITTEAIWLEFSALSGEATQAAGKEITVSVKDNAGMERTGTVTVASGYDEKTFRITQDGLVLKFEETEETRFGCLGATKEFKVNANIPWKPVSDNDDIVLKRLDDETLSVTLAKANKYFTTQYHDITVVPEDESLLSVVEPAVIRVSHQAIAWCSNCSTNEDGSVTLVADNNESRVCTNAGLTTGTLRWTFRDTELTSGLFDINAWQSPGPTFHAWLGGSNDMNTGGLLESKQDFWAAAYNLGVTVDILNAMEVLELTIIPTADESRLVFTMSINGSQIGTFTTPCNPWGEMNESPVPYYFGFAGDSGAVGTMTIVSFEYIPLG